MNWLHCDGPRGRHWGRYGAAGLLLAAPAGDGWLVLLDERADWVHHGGTVEAIVDAALEGAAGRAGIILCGLYGEPPKILNKLVDVAAARPGVLGIDLAGGLRPFRNQSREGVGPLDRHTALRRQ